MSVIYVSWTGGLKQLQMNEKGPRSFDPGGGGVIKRYSCVRRCRAYTVLMRRKKRPKLKQALLDNGRFNIRYTAGLFLSRRQFPVSVLWIPVCDVALYE